MTNESRIARIMAYFNSYHSISGSDWNPELSQKAMKYCEDRIYTLCGLCLGDIPARTEEAVEFLNDYLND